MKIERLKSILLVLLVISSIVLTVNKWFNEKLWPDGYNFFSDIKNYFTSASSSNKSSLSFDPVEEVLKPAKIIINNSGNHILYTKSSFEYNSLFEQIKSALELLSSSKESSEVDINEWNDALKRKSCYFSYPVEYDVGYFSYQLSGDAQIPDVTTVREFVLTSDTRISKVTYIYIKDETTGKIFKYRLDFESSEINNMIERATEASGGTDYYSFELNFDKEDKTGIEQHIVIDPDVLINISQTQIPKISEYNLFLGISTRPDIYNSILQIFGYNTSTIRRYTEHDNSLVFVENYGTLKLHTNALLEYKSLNTTQGVSLLGETTYECINSCISFVNTINQSLGLPEGMYYEISSDIKDIKSKSFTLNFDYYINDRMIIPSENTHSISVEVKSGKIVSYSQICKAFYSLSELDGCPSAIEAIDMLESQSDFKAEKISDLFTAYSYDQRLKVWKPMWFIENESGDILTVSSQTEVVQ